MLASVALIASGGDRYLQSAGGLSQALEQRLAARLPQPEQKTSLQPIAAPQPSSAMPSLAGGSAWINSPALTPERLKGKVVLVDFWTRGVYQLSAYPALRARLGEQIPRGGPGGDWRSYPGISLGAFVAPAAPGGEGLADNLPGGGG
ncbi:cytochrome c biogenesis protein/redoxin [Klebsiella pneumoniae]|nr:cytochrome c biogenesis protein/redoxin [Klebsiella pneumoniae]